MPITDENLSGEKRRLELMSILKASDNAVSGSSLAKLLHVSRQVIVQDIALLRAANNNIYSTNKGYVLTEVSDNDKAPTRIIKVCHNDSQIRDELTTIVEYGGHIIDVRVHHEIYGDFKGELNIKTIKDIDEFERKLHNGEAAPLKNVTSGYHCHTISAPTKKILDLIEEELDNKGYLVK